MSDALEDQGAQMHTVADQKQPRHRAFGSVGHGEGYVGTKDIFVYWRGARVADERPDVYRTCCGKERWWSRSV